MKKFEKKVIEKYDNMLGDKDVTFEGLTALSIILEYRDCFEKYIAKDKNYVAKWVYASSKIAEKAADSDNPEYSLHDYLDALAENDVREEIISAICSEENVSDEIYERIVDETENKRRIYNYG